MRAGYLSVLAARTLGLAPLLQPPTPSRFEPEGPQGGLREVDPVHEEPEQPSGPAPEPEPSAAPSAIQAGDRPLLRPRDGEVDIDIDIDGDRSLRTQAGEAEAGRGDAVLATWPSSGAEGEDGRPGAAPHRQTGGGAPDGRARRAPRMESPATRPRPWPDVRTGRSRQELTSQVAAPQVETAGSAIVVRIGRVDVRAVQPPAPAPAPRPRAAGTSLEEYLGARDRGGR